MTETPPGHHRDKTETTPRQHQNTTETSPKKDTDQTETRLRHDQDRTETSPRQDRDILSEIFSGACAARGRLIPCKTPSLSLLGKNGIGEYTTQFYGQNNNSLYTRIPSWTNLHNRMPQWFRFYCSIFSADFWYQSCLHNFYVPPWMAYPCISIKKGYRRNAIDI